MAHLELNGIIGQCDEIKSIFSVIDKAKWVKNEAAKLQPLNRTTLVEKIMRYEITPSDARSDV